MHIINKPLSLQTGCGVVYCFHASQFVCLSGYASQFVCLSRCFFPKIEKIPGQILKVFQTHVSNLLRQQVENMLLLAHSKVKLTETGSNSENIFSYLFQLDYLQSKHVSHPSTRSRL